ncbi:acyl-CoA thioesterase [Rhizosphaericola mali]|uniref:Thioesterase n=1 Tax=Rhizosphaericola mali TaxID=2545455 RepID=A0A5P2G0S9_9BACT|nr:acyl-CoA thioesterase [Rhizosphaericola mali]QES89414.1 thioesterase [Rhizosphaericola mali]
MKNIFYEGQVLWSMIDANGHLRHSAYADFAAQARVNVLEKLGVSRQLFENKLGPILFREEIIYLKEIRINETIKVSVELTKSKKDHSKYSILCSIFNAENILSSEIRVDGAWLDLDKRKLGKLPEEINIAFEKFPKSSSFHYEDIQY